MSGVCVAFVIFFAIKTSTSFNLNNNACTNYNDYMVKVFSKNCYNNPDVFSDTPSIIHRNGYSLESYTIATQDGYILTIFRIPPRHNKVDKQPVFLMHGLFNSNACWVHSGNRSLAFSLAEKGYDVWLGSIRGSKFANTHKIYNISSKEYWNFNLDSLAYFDVGTQLKFVAKKTARWGSIIYIGYSMGSTLSFLYSSGYPSQANSLLSGIVALAPVLYFKNVPIIKQLIALGPPLERELTRLHIDGLFYKDQVSKCLVNICGTLPQICKKLLSIFSGKLSERFRPDDLLLFFSHTPSGTSVQVLKHYLQLATTGRTRRYDYGRLKNIEYYHLSEPKTYDMRYIKVPIYLFYGKNDALVSEENVKTLLKELGSRNKKMMHIPRNSAEVPYNHMDFIMGDDVKIFLHPEIFAAMEEMRDD